MRSRVAQQAMLAGAVVLTMTPTSDPSWLTYLRAVRDVLAEAENCSPQMKPVWVACDLLIRARSGEDRTKAVFRLHRAVMDYFMRSMADRHADFTGSTEAAA